MNFFKVTPDTARRWLSRGSARLIDVREADEFRNTRVEGAENAPLSRLSPATLLDGHDRTRRLIVICRSGRRSAAAAQQLLDAGAGEVFNLEGGMVAWQRAGFPVAHSKNSPISIMRQVQIVAGSMILGGTVLGAFVSPWFLTVSGFAGAGLLVAGLTDTCAMAALLGGMPWNRQPEGLPLVQPTTAEDTQM